MTLRRTKCLLVAAFSLFWLVSFAQQKADPDGHIVTEDAKHMDKETTKKFDANEVIFGHVLDAHQFHFLSYKGSDGHEHHVTIPLPVILYSPQKGFSVFSSGKFHHGEEEHNGYRLVTQHYKERLAEQGFSEKDLKAYRNESIVAVDENGVVGKGDFYAQAKFILAKLKSVLEEAGFSLDDVIRTRIFATNIRHWEEVGRAHGEFFKNIKPATSMVEVSALIDPEYLVEIEVTALK